MSGENGALIAWLLSWLQGSHGVIVLSLTAFSEAFMLPVLPDLILMPLCYMDPSNAFFYAGLCSVSSIAGGFLGYGVGRFGGRPLFDRLVSDARIRSVERVYQRYDLAVGRRRVFPSPVQTLHHHRRGIFPGNQAFPARFSHGEGTSVLPRRLAHAGIR